MPTLYWVLLNGTAVLLMASFLYDAVIKEHLLSSKRKRRYERIMDVSNDYRRYVKGEK